MNKLKNKKIGRPEYKPNIKQLKKLYAEIRKRYYNKWRGLAKSKLS
mgnify:CR=1 FL=1